MATRSENAGSSETPLELAALRVHQWLPEWEQIIWAPDKRQAKPNPHFYLLSIPARLLKRLTGIERRSTQDQQPRSADTGIQRYHDVERSVEIAKFVRFGYPWSELSEAKRQLDDFRDLRKPGWLPTAIIVNVPAKGAQRRGRVLDDLDAITIADLDSKTATFKLPRLASDPNWTPKVLYPLEVIDGQHRLWAFEDTNAPDSMELPVVAFDNLDISWQAYLFWTINIKPKRINPSLAFDLYPLLRAEEWLDKFAGHPIYRQTRAQELVEALWSHPQSPFRNWINMLGESSARTHDQRPMVSQNTWVRALMATYIKAWDSRRGGGVGGLFGSERQQHEPRLQWTRTQQAAFLILVWDTMRKAVAESQEEWATSLRSEDPKPAWITPSDDLAFRSKFSLFTTDPGIRGVLAVTNDFTQVRADELELEKWEAATESSAVDADAVSEAIGDLRQRPVASFILEIARALTTYDWRTSAYPLLTAEQQRSKAALRGSSGYKQMREDLVNHLAQQDGTLGETARKVSSRLGYGE